MQEATLMHLRGFLPLCVWHSSVIVLSKFSNKLWWRFCASKCHALSCKLSSILSYEEIFLYFWSDFEENLWRKFELAMSWSEVREVFEGVVSAVSVAIPAVERCIGTFPLYQHWLASLRAPHCFGSAYCDVYFVIIFMILITFLFLNTYWLCVFW